MGDLSPLRFKNLLQKAAVETIALHNLDNGWDLNTLRPNDYIYG